LEFTNSFVFYLDHYCKAAKINETQVQSFIGFILNNKTGDISIKPTAQVLHFNNDFPHVKIFFLEPSCLIIEIFS
jgi:hypothetical protein